MSETKQPRVQVVKRMMGICHMNLCCVKDATDAEILEVANRDNPSGTSNGWTRVIRDGYTDEFWPAEKMRPVQCDDDPNRQHIVVGC